MTDETRQVHSLPWSQGYLATYYAISNDPPRPPDDLNSYDLAEWIDGQCWALEQIAANRQAAYDAEMADYRRRSRRIYEQNQAINGGRD